MKKGKTMEKLLGEILTEIDNLSLSEGSDGCDFPWTVVDVRSVNRLKELANEIAKETK